MVIQKLWIYKAVQKIPPSPNCRNSGDDVGLGTVHRPVLMALEEEVTEDGMASTSSLTSSVQSPLKAIASAVFSSSAPSSSSTQHVNGSSTMTTTPKPVKKDIYRGDCQVDDAGRGGQSAAETVKFGGSRPCSLPCSLNNNNNNNGINGFYSPSSPETPAALPDEEAALLAKLEEANRMIELDSKSLNSLAGTGTSIASGHSRKSSDASQISLNSGSSANSQEARSDDNEEDQWSLWGRLVADWANTYKKRNAYVKDLVRKGIPHHFRGVVWPLLCGANDSPAKSQYAEYIKATSACEKVIRRDIARTYPEHDFFKEKDGLGQESLFNVMKAYSLHDREVGYCQGSAFIVGILLMQMPEEEAFAVVVKLMQEYRLREIFKPSMAELGLVLYQLKNLVEELLPDLHAHFLSQSFDTSMYASSWFLTLFSTTLTLSVACRVMDAFLIDGMEIIFRLAVAILNFGKEDLLSQDMEGMLKYFQKEVPARFDPCPDPLFVAAYNVKYSAKRMKKWEKEYTALKTKEQEDQEEVRRLRAENRMLRQKVSMLETESSELAERLVRGQVSRADQEETTFHLKRELEASRQRDAENTAHLRELQQRLKHMEQENYSRQSSLEMEPTTSPSLQAELLKQKEELIQCLQEQLIGGRLRQAEMDSMIRDMKNQLHEHEEDKKRLREATPDNVVLALQEELIAVKLREAEATLALKELRPKISELSSQWLRHLQEEHTTENQPTSLESTPKKLLFWENNRSSSSAGNKSDELMTIRLREMEAVTELRELRLRLMELETQNQVLSNQLKRQDDEIKALVSKTEASERLDKEHQSKIKEHERKYADLEAKMREDSMLARIHDAEHSQHVAELSQKISQLEMKNEQMLTEGELSMVEDSDRVRELQDRIGDLKAEIQRLEHVNRKLGGTNGFSKLAHQQEVSDPSDDDEDMSKLELRFSPRTSVENLTS
ncbi:ecotropic viral integration site 5 ortholog-like isoform X1 [Daphnia pulex]|uniref:ecotropic viral integration site 5 ortholog-like isoform X1 n=2 Tax=Daphnia pulex TaxID=6669 RepID=UPI001EE13176|nr:ecotropic viral integration site 5 ortholog-like isoform X1 [Daphnia pulex]